ALGFTWLATVPPTSGLVGKLFGTRYLSTLFGLTLLSHQVGGFLGAWLGGIALAQLGSYEWIWYADIALAGLAALAGQRLPSRAVPPRLSFHSNNQSCGNSRWRPSFRCAMSRRAMCVDSR